MHPFKYHKASSEEIERLGSAFCDEHGDKPNRIIPEAEYDRLFDHLAETLEKQGTFTEDWGDADFSGYRYVDLIPWITIVPRDGLAPSVALSAGLEAVKTSHRPVAVRFDFHPDYLLVLPPDQVHATFEQDILSAQR